VEVQIELDELQLTEDIDRIAAVIERAVPNAARAQLLGGAVADQLLRQLPDKAMISLALLSDCLAVAHATMVADGRVTQDEIDASFPLLYLASKWYARAVRGYQPFARLTHDDVRGFLASYERDTSPFGYGHRGTRWLGLELCRHAAVAGDAAALDVYEQMLDRLMDALARVAGATPEETRARARIAELVRVRRSLAAAATVEPAHLDRRARSFLTPGPRAFTSVAQAHSMWERDPFDVESVHADVRAAFEGLIDRATTPIRHDHGRIMLVLGESGSGKTHLLRAFRASLHGRRLGYAVYAQLQSRAEDYARYLIGNVVDSLGQPYDRPDDERSGLLLLSNGLVDLLGSPMAEAVDRLRTGDWDDPRALGDFVNGLVDELFTVEDLAGFDPDFLRAVLCLQRRDPRTTSRVIKYLRCEDMNAYDRAYLGDVVPRTDPDDAMRVLDQIGRLAWVTQAGALVILVDQVEDSFAVDGALSFQRAVDTLRRLVEHLPSAVAVIACLDDLWQTVRPRLTQAALDRLERDPAVQRLVVNRTYEEIEAIVSRRLQWLYEQAGASFHPEEPVYPIPARELRDRANRRTRDILDYCHRFREACLAAGRLLDGLDGARLEAPPLPPPPAGLDIVDTTWNDARNAAVDLPEEDDEIIAAIAAAARMCGDELAGGLRVDTARTGDILAVDLGSESAVRRLAIGVANKGYQRGAFGRQVEAIRSGAHDRAVVVVRTSEYPAGKGTHQVISALRQSGGRNVVLTAGDLRAIVAMTSFAPAASAEVVALWRHERQPIASLASVRELFDLDALEAAMIEEPARPEAGEAGGEKEAEAEKEGEKEAEAGGEKEAERAGGAASRGTGFALGVTRGFRREPVLLPAQLLCRHTAVLGTPGSGKTTLALNLLEQAAASGVAVLLVDRKGDLAAYARPDWWRRPSDDVERRRRELAERTDVRLFTPGSEIGRPLSFGVVPRLDGLPAHERARAITFAAHALASMMKLAEIGESGSRRAILREAIAVLAEAGHTAADGLAGHRTPRAADAAGRDLPSLIQLVHERHDELVARVPLFSDKLFSKLVNELETLRVASPELFDAGAEQLTAETLLAPARDGRTAFTIVSTKFLGDTYRVQFWIARLLVELARWSSRAPANKLQALLMFDEADLYLPAGASKPPSKEPMQELLRRGRAGGVGVILASQSPGDFDYRVRDLITTWFVGKIGDRRSIDKMKPLFEGVRAGVAQRLPQQATGQFVLMSEGTVRDIDARPSLMVTEQLPEAELLALAGRGAPPRPDR